MSAKRIRCECGHVYQPEKHPTCPSCGAQATTVATIEPPKALPAAEDEALVRRDEAERTVTDEDAKPIAISGRTVAIIGGAFVALLLVLSLVRRNPGPATQTPANPEPTQAATPAPSATAVVQASAGNQSFIAPQQFDLAAAVASAAPGATIKVPPGFYSGGITLTKAVRLIGAANQTIIQSEGRECLVVKAPGVFVQGMQFMCNGIGDLPAISVADGASLELDTCRVQSATGVGLTSSGNAAISALGTTFSATNGTAARIYGGKAMLTQSTFSDSKQALNVANGTKVELKACAFERNGSADNFGGIITAADPGTNVIATDCQFTGNYSGMFVTQDAVLTGANCTFKDNMANARSFYGLIAITKGGRVALNNSRFEGNKQGIVASDRGTIEMDQCSFRGNGAQTRDMSIEILPLSIRGDGSTGNIRNSVFIDSLPYAIAMLDRANATFDHVEVAGSKAMGIAIGDTDNPPAHAEILHSKFHDNGDTGVGIFGGSTAKIDDCIFQQNKDGVTVAERNAEAELHKVQFAVNNDHGLLVYSGARVMATDCTFFHNARGAQVGLPRGSKGRASLTIDGAESGGNRVFGAGAFAQNELTLRNVNFQGDDKTAIYKERNAIVQNDAAANPAVSPSSSAGASPQAGQETKPSEDETPQPSASPSGGRKPRPTPRPRRTARPEDDAARILRQIFRPR